MGLLNRFFGYRWSLYIVFNGNQLCYVVHENSVVRILGYLINRFRERGDPVPPWSLHLNFNRAHTSFPLRRQHFSDDGDDLSPLLLGKLREIDAKFDQIPGAEPVVFEATTKRSIPISSSQDWEDITNHFSDLARDDEVTLFTILDDVFGITDTAKDDV